MIFFNLSIAIWTVVIKLQVMALLFNVLSIARFANDMSAREEFNTILNSQLALTHSAYVIIFDL